MQMGYVMKKLNSDWDYSKSGGCDKGGQIGKCRLEEIVRKQKWTL